METKLSIVIICWNDLKVIENCLRSIQTETTAISFEIIISDNGSTDGSIPLIREKFPTVRIVENRANLGFAKGNNSGIQAANGEYTLILNPDTIILDRALDRLIGYADQHPEAGAFGCRVLNPDGTFQNPAKPLPSLSADLLAALYLRWLARIFPFLPTDIYHNWSGETERKIGVQSGCCVLLRTDLLKRLGGFDERFFYHREEVDLCYRVWASGSCILYYPEARITHIGGQSVGRFPIRFALETKRSGYRFFYKYFGRRGARRIRRIYLLHTSVRWFGYKLISIFKPSEALVNRLTMYRVLLKWNWLMDPVQFIEKGQEPNVGYEPMALVPNMTEATGRFQPTQSLK